jgi:hypothetical protein
MGKLTNKQWKRLREIHNVLVPPASFWSTSTDRSLVKRGLIERCDQTRQLAHNVAFITHLCRLTDAGRAALAAATGGGK